MPRAGAPYADNSARRPYRTQYENLHTAASRLSGPCRADLREREGQLEDASLLAARLELDRPAHLRDDLLADVEAKTDAAVRLGAARPEEAVEDVRPLGVRNADAFVAHANDGGVAVAADLDQDRPALRTVFDGVVEEVFHDLDDAACIGVDGESAVAREDDDGMLRIGRVLIGCPAGDFRENDRFRLEHEAARIQPGHVEQVVDERGQRFRALLRLHDELLRARAVAFGHLTEREIELQLDRGDRGPDLVAGHAEELRALTLERAQCGDVLKHRDRRDDLDVAQDRRRAHEDVQVNVSRGIAEDDLLASDVLAAQCANDRELLDLV